MNRVGAPDDVKDEGAVSDVLAEITEVFKHPLVTTVVLGDGKIALREDAGRRRGRT